MQENKADAEAVLARVTKRVRNIYCECRGRYCHTAMAPGPKYDKHFERVARWCVAYGINPREFIEVQFYASKPYPYINQLSTNVAMKLFFDYRKEYAVAIGSAVLLQMAAWEKLLGIGRDPHDVLTDHNQEFDVLFRYVVSKHAGLEDLASLYWDEALELYLTSFYYDEVYKDLIPDEMKKAAEEVRNYGDA